jgi:hypothetical protein
MYVWMELLLLLLLLFVVVVVVVVKFGNILVNIRSGCDFDCQL